MLGPRSWPCPLPITGSSGNPEPGSEEPWKLYVLVSGVPQAFLGELRGHLWESGAAQGNGHLRSVGT